MNEDRTRVLLADDDVELCELLVRYLDGEGFDVETVHDGRAAVERLTGGEFAIGILDVMMPRLGGLEALGEVRRSSRVPVLMLTARGDDVDRIVGLELGADDYLPKPCNPRELVARLRAILRRAQPASAAPGERIETGDLMLDRGTRDVRVGGEVVELTSAEFGLLEALLDPPGKVVTKDLLSERALGRGLTPYDRSIDVHVSHLRRKLGAHADGGPRIKTVRGVGYLYVGSNDESS